MQLVDSRNTTTCRSALRAVAVIFAVAAFALCAYAGGQARGTGTQLTAIKARAATGRAAAAGPSANVNQAIRLIGSGFDSNVSVQFTAFANSTFSVLPLQVKGRKVFVSVPAQTVTGPVRLLDPESGTSEPLTLQIVPKIESLTPTSVAIGAQLFVDGTGFTSDAKVTFKGVSGPVTPTVVSPTRIDIIVPAGAQTGRITVVTNGGTSKAVKLTIPGSVAEAAAQPTRVAAKAAPKRTATTRRAVAKRQR